MKSEDWKREDWKKEYDNVIELYDNIRRLKEELKSKEETFEKLMRKLMPEIWIKYASGTYWERDRPFFASCSDCSTMAITILKDKK